MGVWRNDYADSLQKVTVNTPAGDVECVAASYDGVPFFIEETETSGGREVVTSPLPFSDKHVNEDVGKKVRSFAFTIFLVGPNCNVDREKLEESFNKNGYFELSHPYYGKFDVRCAEYRFKYSSSVLEYVSGEVTFVPEEDPKKSARSVEDLRGVVVAKSDDAISAAKSEFVEKFNILGKAKSVVDSVSSYVVGIMDKIDGIRASVRDVSEFIQTLSRIRENVQLIMKTPADFANRIQLLLTMTKETFSPEGGFNDYVNESLAVMSSDKDHSKMNGPSSDELGSLIDRLIVMTSASMVARSVVDCSFVSTDEAIEMQNSVVAAFEIAMQSVDSVEDYSNLADLEASALKYLRDEMSRLADVVELPLSGTRDVLTICYDCYGSLDKLDDIIERNSIGDPLLVTRESLKVLSK